MHLLVSFDYLKNNWLFFNIKHSVNTKYVSSRQVLIKCCVKDTKDGRQNAAYFCIWGTEHSRHGSFLLREISYPNIEFEGG